MFKTKGISSGALVGQLMLPLPCDCEGQGSNPRYVTFFLSFFIENNLSYLIGGNIISVGISATAGGNITSVALTDTCFLVSISSASQ